MGHIIQLPTRDNDRPPSSPTSPGGVVLPHPNAKIAPLPRHRGDEPSPGVWQDLCPDGVSVVTRRLSDGTLRWDISVKVARGAGRQSRTFDDESEVAYYLRE